MAKEEKTSIPSFREQLILFIARAKADDVSLDEIESALHCEIDGVKTALSALNKTKKKKA